MASPGTRYSGRPVFRKINLASRRKVLFCVPAPANSSDCCFLYFLPYSQTFSRFLFLVYFICIVRSHLTFRVYWSSATEEYYFIIRLLRCGGTTLSSPINNSVRDVAGPAEVAAATTCYTHPELRRKKNAAVTESYLTPYIHYWYMCTQRIA